MNVDSLNRRQVLEFEYEGEYGDVASLGPGGLDSATELSKWENEKMRILSID